MSVGQGDVLDLQSKVKAKNVDEWHGTRQSARCRVSGWEENGICLHLLFPNVQPQAHPSNTRPIALLAAQFSPVADF